MRCVGRAPELERCRTRRRHGRDARDSRGPSYERAAPSAPSNGTRRVFTGSPVMGALAKTATRGASAGGALDVIAAREAAAGPRRARTPVAARHMSTMVRSVPRRSQRRPEVTTRSRRHAGREMRFKRFESATSSMRRDLAEEPAGGIEGRAANEDRLVAGGDAGQARATRSCDRATTASSGSAPAIDDVEAAPLRAVPDRLRAMATCAAGGQDAYRHGGRARTSPCARVRAGIHLRSARRARLQRPRSASRAARLRVASRLPPSTTTTSAPRSRTGCSRARQASMARGLVENAGR